MVTDTNYCRFLLVSKMRFVSFSVMTVLFLVLFIEFKVVVCISCCILQCFSCTSHFTLCIIVLLPLV